MPKNEKAKKLLTVRVDEELAAKAAKHAAAQGTTVSELVREFLERVATETT